MVPHIRSIFLVSICLLLGELGFAQMPRMAYRIQVNYTKSQTGGDAWVRLDQGQVLNSLRTAVEEAVSQQDYSPTLAAGGMMEAKKKKAKYYLTIVANIDLKSGTRGLEQYERDIPVHAKINFSLLELTEVASKKVNSAKGPEVFERCAGSTFGDPSTQECWTAAFNRAKPQLQESLSSQIKRASQMAGIKKELNESQATLKKIKEMVDKPQEGTLKQIQELLKNQKFDGK